MNGEIKREASFLNAESILKLVVGCCLSGCIFTNRLIEIRSIGLFNFVIKNLSCSYSYFSQAMNKQNLKEGNDSKRGMIKYIIISEEKHSILKCILNAL